MILELSMPTKSLNFWAAFTGIDFQKFTKGWLEVYKCQMQFYIEVTKQGHAVENTDYWKARNEAISGLFYSWKFGNATQFTFPKR